MPRGEVYLTDLERKVKKALDEAGLSYVMQYPTRTGFVLDFAILDRQIAIEADGPHHDVPARRSKDAFRTLRLKQEGWRIVRIHWDQEPENIIRAL